MGRIAGNGHRRRHLKPRGLLFCVSPFSSNAHVTLGMPEGTGPHILTVLYNSICIVMPADLKPTDLLPVSQGTYCTVSCRITSISLHLRLTVAYYSVIQKYSDDIKIIMVIMI